MYEVQEMKRTIAKQLVTLRTNKGITQKNLVKEIGDKNLSLRSYVSYEKGKEKFLPSLEKLLLISKYYNVPLDYITNGKMYTDDNSFTWEDSLKRLSRLIYSQILIPIKELNEKSDYYGKYYLLAYDKETELFLDRINLFSKGLNYSFINLRKAIKFTPSDYDKHISNIKDNKEILIPSFERFNKILKRANIDPNQYQKEHIEKINKARKY